MSYASVVTLRTKSPEAFRTISEVADELRVPQHVLRFWESRFSQVKPLKRAGGRRYYRPDDVDLLRGIRALLYGDGFTVKGVQKILRDKGARYVIEIGKSVVPDGMVIMRDDSDVFLEDDEMPTRNNIVAIGVRPSPSPVQELQRTAEAAYSDKGENTKSLAEEARERLEILLAELVQLKMRLRASRN